MGRCPAGLTDLGVAEQSHSLGRMLFAIDGDRSRLSLRNRAVFDLAETLSGQAPPFAALMYVWGKRAAPESLFHCYRTDRVRRILLKVGDARRGQCLHHWRGLMAGDRCGEARRPGRQRPVSSGSLRVGYFPWRGARVLLN